MTGYVPTQGQVHHLDEMTSADHSLRLHSNNVTLALTSAQIAALDESDFVECTFPGYSAKTLTGGSWTVAGSDPSTATYALQTFARSTSGASQNVWGFYLTRDSDDALVWLETFPAPLVVASTGQEVRVIPILNYSDRAGDLMPVGTMNPWPGSAAPPGWLLCDGSAVSRSTYSELFALISDTYGAGDGSTTFNLPDMRGRFPLGKAVSGTGSTLGGSGGTLDHVHPLDGANAVAQLWAGVGTSQLRARLRATTPPWAPGGTITGVTVSGGSGTDSSGLGLQGDTQGSNPAFRALNYVIRSG